MISTPYARRIRSGSIRHIKNEFFLCISTPFPKKRYVFCGNPSTKEARQEDPRGWLASKSSQW